MAHQVLMYAHQNPKGRALKMTERRVYVFSECCNATVRVVSCKAYCNACEAILEPRCDFSSSFPVTALQMKREHDYWWPWGEWWFGLSEFSIEGDFDG